MQRLGERAERAKIGFTRNHTETLWQRYAGVFKSSWAIRHTTDTPERLPHESAFLPAALALQDTPVSPAPLVAIRLSILFVVAGVVWACFGELDIVATARGRVIPDDRVKAIQPFETAVVARIAVQEGAMVKAGDLLLELDATVAQADGARVQNELHEAQMASVRAQSLLNALARMQWSDPVHSASVTAAQQAANVLLARGIWDEFQTRIQRFDAEWERREAERLALTEMVNKLSLTAPIAAQRSADFRQLMEAQFVSNHAWLERESVRLDQEGELATQKRRLQEIVAAQREVTSQRAAWTAEARRMWLDSLSQARQRQATAEQEWLKAQQRSRLTRLTAPVAGRVQQLAIHTVGAVVTPAQVLLQIVPDDAHPEIEAFLENRDVGFVRPGQVAQVKVETFPFTKYGTVEAQVHMVAADAVADERGAWLYAARFRPRTQFMQVDGRQARLSPGMAVSVEIKTGRRTVMDYFLSPLVETTRESLRER